MNCFIKEPHPIKKLSILRIDSDTLHATLLILERLYSLLVPGGSVVVDDFHLAGCRLAVLNNREKNNLTSPIMPVPKYYIMSSSILSPSSSCTNEITQDASLGRYCSSSEVKIPEYISSTCSARRVLAKILSPGIN